jgi:hypothetical protein
MFHELQIIMDAFLKALHTVMWVGLLTIILNYICAVFLTQTIGHNADMWGDEHREDIEQWFGSIGNSMRTLFIIITLAEWDQIALIVSKHVNGFLVFTLAIAYITLTAFTMVSLITGIISEELVGAQREDEVHKLEQIEKGKTELAENVKNLLVNFDEDATGTLSVAEVKDGLNNPNLKLIDRLQALDITLEMEDFLSLISRLQDACGSEEIPIDDIAQALKHLSGTASSSSIWDLKMLLLQIQKDNAVASKAIDTVGDDLSKLSGDFQNSSSSSQDTVDQVLGRLSTIEATCQSENVRLDNKLNTLVDGLGRLEGKLQSQKSRMDDRVVDRLVKLEEIMHVLCSHMVNGTAAAAVGTGESNIASNDSRAVCVAGVDATAVQPNDRQCLR